RCCACGTGGTPGSGDPSAPLAGAWPSRVLPAPLPCPSLPLPSRSLPAVVSERPVRFRHLVHVLAPLHRGSLAGRGVHDLPDQTLGHGVLPAGPRVVDQPPEGQRGPPVGSYLDGNLVRSTPDPP